MNRSSIEPDNRQRGTNEAEPILPVVVQLGFAGSRTLLDTAKNPAVDPAAFEKAVQRKLVECLAELPGRLGLAHYHFLCGHSQIAIGADTLFTRACQA
jgi:hypothetical protein